MYLAKRFIVPAIHLYINRYSQATAHHFQYYISNYNSRSRYIKQLVKHWRILSYIVFTPLFLLVSIALTVVNTFSACLFDLRVGWINPGTFGVALTSCCPGHSRSSILLSCSISDSISAAEWSLLSSGLSQSPFQLNQSTVSKMVSGKLSSSLSSGWRLIIRIQQIFNIWVRSLGKSFADRGGGKWGLSDDSIAAASSCWKSDHDALMIASKSEIYPTVVICLVWAQDSFWVARRFWLPCHISKPSWTLDILFNCIFFAAFLILVSFSVFVVSHSGSAPAKIPLLARANCLTTTLWQRVSPVVIDSLRPITSQRREKQASTPTQCGLIEKMTCVTYQRWAYIEWIPSCWHHQSVISGNQHVLPISIGTEW